MQVLEVNNESNSKIKLLPDYLVDQIKAGEVVERPSALLKELLENSLDAHALEINITLKSNGLDLILIEDDGEGMSFEDLKMAFQRHATSKINKYEDLYSLNSFGFRGEALASAASISRISCFSSPHNSSQGGKIIIEAGQVIYHQKEHASAGTSLAIRDLFFNTPARLKFIKGQLAEKNSIKKIINSFLISNPEVKWSIQLDDKEKEIYPKKNHEGRFRDVIRRNKKENIKIENFTKNYQNICVELLISKAHSTSEVQMIFVNSRMIEDRAITAITLKALQNDKVKIQGIDQKFNYAIFINTPLDFVDVNVHPNKTIVKFQNFSIINSLIYNVCQEASLAFKPEQKEYLQNNEVTKLPTNPAIPEIRFEKDINHNEKLFILGGYYLYLKNEKLEIINYDQLIQSQISCFYNRHQPRDDLLIPLLIALPLQFNNNSELMSAAHALKALDIDYKSQDNLILIKGIPPFLNELGTTVWDVIREFLKYSLNLDEKYESNLIKFITLEKLKAIMPYSELSSYLEKVGSTLQDTNPYKRSIDSSQLQLFFNQL